ncbi:MAG TPA: hypothetical protein VH116_09105 [Gemmatimonadales bacterium]|jgi:hypothetical protein|nr:hypothetical protein [Gemmatimonadales bacterium]
MPKKPKQQTPSDRAFEHVGSMLMELIDQAEGAQLDRLEQIWDALLTALAPDARIALQRGGLGITAHAGRPRAKRAD